MIEPRNDYLLVRRAPQLQGSIYTPDIAQQKGIIGEVLAVGPGRWIPGEWWKLKTGWEWFDGYRQPMSVHPGQTVAFNSRWNDFAGDHQDDLTYDKQADLHLIQEADIFSIL